MHALRQHRVLRFFGIVALRIGLVGEDAAQGLQPPIEERALFGEGTPRHHQHQARAGERAPGHPLHALDISRW